MQQKSWRTSLCHYLPDVFSYLNPLVVQRIKKKVSNSLTISEAIFFKSTSFPLHLFSSVFALPAFWAPHPIGGPVSKNSSYLGWVSFRNLSFSPWIVACFLCQVFFILRTKTLGVKLWELTYQLSTFSWHFWVDDYCWWKKSCTSW